MIRDTVFLETPDSRAMSLIVDVLPDAEASEPADFLRTVVGLETIFDGLLVSAELGYTKDMVNFFAAAYGKINAQEKTPFEKGSVLFVDHEEKNLAAAQAFGLATHAYHDVTSFRAAISS